MEENDELTSPGKFLIRLSQIASQFDRKLFQSKVVSIDKGRFDRRQESVHSVSSEITIYQICLKIFSLAVDKRTKNNQAMSLTFYHHLLFYRNLCNGRTDVWFRSNEHSIKTTFYLPDSMPFLKEKIGKCILIIDCLVDQPGPVLSWRMLFCRITEVAVWRI